MIEVATHQTQGRPDMDLFRSGYETSCSLMEAGLEAASMRFRRPGSPLIAGPLILSGDALEISSA